MNEHDRDIQTLITGRIYHEDTLLTQRTYNFLTVNVFLGAALFVGFDQTHGQLTAAGHLVSVIGVVLAALQIALGRRTVTAITFWRTYLKQVESKTRLHLDHLLFLFYEAGQVQTPFGVIRKKDPSGRSVYQTFPWNVMPSTNTMYGVLLPWLVQTIWFALLSASFVSAQHARLAVATLVL